VVDQATLVDEDSVITVGDLDIPEGVKIDLEDDVVVASVAAAREEEPETVPESEESGEGTEAGATEESGEETNETEGE